jgi:predicted Abi (CAAX) family protease
MMGEIKKWIFSLIVVLLYDKVVLQLLLLIGLNSFMFIYKIITRPYRNCVENILVEAGDLIFVVILGLKFNDYNNM